MGKQVKGDAGVQVDIAPDAELPTTIATDLSMKSMASAKWSTIDSEGAIREGQYSARSSQSHPSTMHSKRESSILPQSPKEPQHDVVFTSPPRPYRQIYHPWPAWRDAGSKDENTLTPMVSPLVSRESKPVTPRQGWFGITETSRYDTQDTAVTKEHSPTPLEMRQSVQSSPSERKVVKPLKGILKNPTTEFSPGERRASPIREDFPPPKHDLGRLVDRRRDQRTEISLMIVDPEVLIGKERFSVRGNFVIVHRFLDSHEIEEYANSSLLLREKKQYRGDLDAHGTGREQYEDGQDQEYKSSADFRKSAWGERYPD
jgi:hypothetical protein